VRLERCRHDLRKHVERAVDRFHQLVRPPGLEQPGGATERHAPKSLRELRQLHVEHVLQLGAALGCPDLYRKPPVVSEELAPELA
jgi:hypothetical protein